MTDKKLYPIIQHRILEVLSKNKKIDSFELKSKISEYSSNDISNNIMILVQRGCILIDDKWKMSIGETFLWP